MGKIMFIDKIYNQKLRHCGYEICIWNTGFRRNYAKCKTCKEMNVWYQKVLTHCTEFCRSRDFPGGTVVKNPPANAGDTDSRPGLGRSHMPRSN